MKICSFEIKILAIKPWARLTGLWTTRKGNLNNDGQVKPYLCWKVNILAVFSISVTNVRACKAEPRVARLFLRPTAFFLFIYLFIYLFVCLFIFRRFQFDVFVFLSEWCTCQKKHKFSIFIRAWNSPQVVSVICWRSLYIFRYEWNFELSSQHFVSKCWLCKID